MKSNWPLKKLGEVAEIIVGKTPATIDYLNGGDYKVLKYRDISKNGISWNISDKGFVKQASLKGLKEVQIGDLLITSAGHSSEKIGEEAVVVEELPSQFKKVFFASELICYRTISKIILPEWLLLYILSEFGQKQLKQIIGDSVHLTKEKSQEIGIPVPGIEKQRRILKKLEKILAKIEESRTIRQESIVGAQILLKSAIYNHFSKTTANKEKFRDVAVLERGKFTPRPRNDPRYFGGSTPWIQIGDITNKQGKYINSYSGTLNEEGLAVSRMFTAGTVVTSIAASIGTTGILGFDSAFPDSLIGIRGKEVINSYVYYYLQFMQSHLDHIAPQSAQKNINLKILGDIEIPVPEIKEQEKIVAYLDGLSEKVRTLQKLQQEQLQDLEALKQSILHQTFQGDLVR